MGVRRQAFVVLPSVVHYICYAMHFYLEIRGKEWVLATSDPKNIPCCIIESLSSS